MRRLKSLHPTTQNVTKNLSIMLNKMVIEFVIVLFATFRIFLVDKFKTRF